MKTKNVEIRENIAQTSISEIFYNKKHVGDIEFFEGIWWYREPNAIMWWRSYDFDSCVSEILKYNGITNN